jgi:hypothetical protein
VRDLSDVSGIPGGEGFADPVHLSRRAGPEQLGQLADEHGIAEGILGPAQFSHNCRVEHLFSRHG